jgi:hypothetical protein
MRPFFIRVRRRDRRLPLKPIAGGFIPLPTLS